MVEMSRAFEKRRYRAIALAAHELSPQWKIPFDEMYDILDNIKGDPSTPIQPGCLSVAQITNYVNDKISHKDYATHVIACRDCTEVADVYQKLKERT